MKKIFVTPLCVVLFYLTQLPFAVAESEVIEESQTLDQLKAAIAENPKNAQAHYDLGMLLLKAEKKEEGLTNLEMAITLEPKNLKFGSDYRMKCIALEEFDWSIQFFEKLVKENEKLAKEKKEIKEEKEIFELHIQLGMAYVDKMPTVARVSQGILSNRSIREFTTVLEHDPKNWAACFGRAMNYLYWPRIFNKSTNAIEDFQKCMELQRETNLESYYVRSYIGLGDAYVKNNQTAEAKEIWEQGIKLFPDNEELKIRVATPEKDMLALVEKKRALGTRVDTNLEELWKSIKKKSEKKSY